MKEFYFMALFIFILKIFGALVSLASIKENKIGPASFGLGPQICYTSILLFFCFAAMVKRK